MKKIESGSFIIILFSPLILVLFQNCSKSGFTTDLVRNSSNELPSLCQNSNDCSTPLPQQTTPPAPVTGNKVRLNILANNSQNFGNGPSIKFWFSGRNLNSSTAVNSTDIEVGSAYQINLPSTNPWNYWYDSRSARYFTPTVDNLGASGNSAFQFTVDMGKAFAQEEGYLVSFRFVIPNSYYYPGTDANFWNGSNTAVGSSFKMAWAMSTPSDTTNSDLVLLSHAGGGALITSGNGMSVGASVNDNHWFSGLEAISRTDHSNRFLSYFQRSSNLVSGDKSRIEWSLANTLAHTYANADRTITYNVNPINHRFINFPGWMDTQRNDRGNSSTSQTLYGDVYVAQGPTARARLEIGDSPNYQNCKWLFIAPPVSWTNNSVIIDFYPDEIQKSNYWFLTTSDGTRYSGLLEK